MHILGFKWIPINVLKHYLIETHLRIQKKLICLKSLNVKPVRASNQALTVWKELKFETHFGFQQALRASNEG